MEAIDITPELERFDTHLKNNPRTIFSARFGDGKTYFIRKYMERHDKDTMFIVLHPISYSVAANEDVFEYIKRDILVELSKLPEFKNVNWKAVAESIFNLDTLLEINEKLVEALPEQYGFIPIKPMSKLALIPAQILKKVDDKVSIEKYFERFSEMKGGIFEQDQYTEAIKAIIAKIQENDRRCVLIIEDLDRIDPKHLFRILNVLGAHIDEDNNTNKFGFDNIVAVLDYNTTKHIFHHFYGGEANYDGYMLKFISHTFFEYSITRIAKQMLLKYLQEECKLIENDLAFGWHSDGRDGPHSIKAKMEKLSVRDIVNVLDGIEQQYETSIFNIGTYKIDPQEPIVKLFAVLTRLNIKIEIRRVLEFLHQSTEHYSLFGAFVVAKPELLGRMLEIKDRGISFTAETEGDITSINITPVMGGIVETHQDKTESIISEVFKCVHDCIPIEKIKS